MELFRQPVCEFVARRRDLVSSWAGIAIIFRRIVATRGNAAEVLLESDAGFFRCPRGIRFNRLQKILDLLLNLG
jgi:hypothetical protein